MPSRIQLEQRARVVGISPSAYPNDSRLEQRVIYAEKNMATVAGTLPTGTLTSDATNNANGDQILLGVTRTYTYVTALTETAASQTITNGNSVNVSDGDMVVIGNQTYTFRTTIAKPNDVHIGTTADNSLTNLSSAITGGGTIGTDYGNGTVTNTQVTAGSVSSHVLTVTALTVGVFANGFVFGTTAASLTMGGASLSGGVDPVANQILIGASASVSLDNTKSAINGTAGAGTTYSSGTPANVHVTAGTKTSTTLVVTANTQSSGQTINTTVPVGSHLSWGATTLTGGTQPIIVAPTDALAGQTGGAAV